MPRASKAKASKKAPARQAPEAPRTDAPKGAEKKHRIYSVSFQAVYIAYIAKVERKGRSQAEVDEVIRWLTGYSQAELEKHLANKTDFETFFGRAHQLNPARSQIKGTICGVRIEEIADPLMKEIRHLDKLIDELAQGRPMSKVLRAG
jgi:hypothetical protein